MNSSAINEQVALKAAEFFFLLRTGDASPQDVRACEQWRAADPAHEHAWQNAKIVSKKFDLLPPTLSATAFARGNDKARRQAVKSLAALLVAAPVGWALWRSQPAREMRADYRTGTGQRKDIVLEDGTRVYLNSATAINVAFDAVRRVVTLIEGEILIETAPDKTINANQSRPFMVVTAQGTIKALGTRFMVWQGDGITRVALFEGRVEIRPSASNRVAGQDGDALVLEAGQQVSFSDWEVNLPQALARHADAWLEGRLYASDMRLDDFLAELGRHRPGMLRCEDSIASLRISGVFQLRDTEQVLNSLPNALPVDVRYRTRYWVTVVPAT